MTTLTPNRDAIAAGVEDVRRQLAAKALTGLQEQTTAQFTVGCLTALMVTAGEAKDRGLPCEEMVDAACGGLANALLSLAGFVCGGSLDVEGAATDIMIRLTRNMRHRLVNAMGEAVAVTVPDDVAGQA